MLKRQLVVVALVFLPSANIGFQKNEVLCFKSLKKDAWAEMRENWSWFVGHCILVCFIIWGGREVFGLCFWAVRFFF